MRAIGTSRLRALMREPYRVVRHHGDSVSNQAWLAQRLAALELQMSNELANDPLSSRVACQADCGADYERWSRRLGLPVHIHRKFWEYAAVGRALDAAGCLGPGRRGLGFAVGKEPLAAAFADLGCEIVASDLAETDPRASSWVATNQHASGNPAVTAVSVREVDMTDIPADLVGFDFCWSSCAFEHLGSIEAGLEFVEASVRCLRPGGWAVHTTEYNLDGDLDGSLDTVERGQTVFYRRSDIDGLERRLARSGHRMAPLVPWRLTGILDVFVDVVPYRYLSLILRWHGVRATSAIVVIQAAP